MNIDNIIRLTYFIGFLGMILIMIIRRTIYNCNIYQSFLITVCLLFGGIIGIKLLFFVENGYFGGYSFYGAMFFVPVILYFLSICFPFNYPYILSYSAPAGCIMLFVMRFACWKTGCCGGNDIYNRFIPIPLQLLDGLLALLVMVCLLYFEKIDINKRRNYGWYMLLQGFIRLVINNFRDYLNIFLLIPAGHLWSILAVLIGGFYVTYPDIVNGWIIKNISRIRNRLNG